MRSKATNKKKSIRAKNSRKAKTESISEKIVYFKDRYNEQIGRFEQIDLQSSKMVALLGFLGFLYFRSLEIILPMINGSKLMKDNMLVDIFFYAPPFFIFISYLSVLGSMQVKELIIPPRNKEFADSFLNISKNDLELFIYNTYVDVISNNMPIISRKRKFTYASGTLGTLAVVSFVGLIIIINLLGDS